MDRIADSTNMYSRVYFLSFYMIANLLILGVFISFVIDTFVETHQLFLRAPNAQNIDINNPKDGSTGAGKPGNTNPSSAPPVLGTETLPAKHELRERMTSASQKLQLQSQGTEQKAWRVNPALHLNLLIENMYKVNRDSVEPQSPKSTTHP